MIITFFDVNEIIKDLVARKKAFVFKPIPFLT